MTSRLINSWVTTCPRHADDAATICWASGDSDLSHDHLDSYLDQRRQEGLARCAWFGTEQDDESRHMKANEESTRSLIAECCSIYLGKGCPKDA